MKNDSRVNTLGMSKEAKALIDNIGEELGAKYFRKDPFESIMRPSYNEREANSMLMMEEANGDSIEYTNQPVDTMYGLNHVYTLAPAHYQRIILYVHGGAYVHNAAVSHGKFCDRLATELNAKVVMPMYTLAPQGTWKEAYPLLHQLWNEIVKEELPAFVMGDSAGGGLALGFVEELAENEEPLPQKMAFLSPWVDVTLCNPDIVNYEADDISLAVYGLVECAKMWTDGLDMKDWRVSPVYYDHFEKLPPTLLFAGTAEIFYPDVTKLYKTMLAADVETSLVTGTGLYHVFPVYTMTPESDESRQMIAEFFKAE